MGIVFEWDSRKARSNYAKHQVSFEEASTRPTEAGFVLRRALVINL